MNLSHLEAFVAVAKSLSFTKAAKQLHISQPALSNQIKLLEQSLEVPLFVRDRHSVALSAAGKELLDDAESLLADAEKFRQRARRTAGGARGVLRVGFVASATMDIVPRLTVALRKHFPEVSLQLKNIPSVAQIEQLKHCALDAGIVRLPLHESDIDVIPLHSEPFAIVFSKQHSLRARKVVTVRDLADESFIAYTEQQAPAFFQQWTGICRRAGFTPRIVQEVAEMETALALIAAGVGVGILPEGLAKRHARTLVVQSLRTEPVRSEIGLAFRKADTSALTRHLIASATEAGRKQNSGPRRTPRSRAS